MNYISLMIAIPLIGAIISFFTRTRAQARMVALIASLVPLAISLQMYMGFDKTSKMMQFVESYTWVPSIGVKYTVGVDGIGLPLVLLSTIVSVLVIIYSWGEDKRPNQFFALLLLNEVGVLGVFTALDFAANRDGFANARWSVFNCHGVIPSRTFLQECSESAQPDGIVVADFNNDGGIDIAVANAGEYDVSVLLRNPVI